MIIKKFFFFYSSFCWSTRVATFCFAISSGKEHETLILNGKSKDAWSLWQNQAYQIMYFFISFQLVQSPICHNNTMSDHIVRCYNSCVWTKYFFFRHVIVFNFSLENKIKRGKRLHYIHRWRLCPYHPLPFIHISLNVIFILNYRIIAIFTR